ncbi:hypothetical protein [Bradyrhizobium retamae]|uniref:Uncharacterized protein n=1 Tax=Bradyrhizobium retamae TaxID=1300035 RepID=A0A0R3NCW8_9BRAD|nr:hypothetical protein [Bradyrhizobium retamae]KRR29963.1 hypothetical protein CQ13_14240 [Bradyrhizobium retamae]
MFVLLGPVLGVLIGFSVVAIAIRGYAPDLYGVPIAFLFSLVVCAITGPVDGVLAWVVPVSLRVPLTAIVGAAVAVGLVLFLAAQLGGQMTPPLHTLIPIAVIGAINTGACSLLTYYWRRRKA